MENELEEIETPVSDYEEVVVEQMPEQLLYGPAPTQYEPPTPVPPTTMEPEQLLYGPAPTQEIPPTPEPPTTVEPEQMLYAPPPTTEEPTIAPEPPTETEEVIIEPTEEEPTPEPTEEPTPEPVEEPTEEEPVVEPTVEPTIEPTVEPIVEPTTEPIILRKSVADANTLVEGVHNVVKDLNKLSDNAAITKGQFSSTLSDIATVHADIVGGLERFGTDNLIPAMQRSEQIQENNDIIKKLQSIDMTDEDEVTRAEKEQRIIDVINSLLEKNKVLKAEINSLGQETIVPLSRTPDAPPVQTEEPVPTQTEEPTPEPIEEPIEEPTPEPTEIPLITHDQLLYGPAPTQYEPPTPVPPTTIVIDQLLYGPAPIPDEPTIAPIPFDEESGE